MGNSVSAWLQISRRPIDPRIPRVNHVAQHEHILTNTHTGLTATLLHRKSPNTAPCTRKPPALQIKGTLHLTPPALQIEKTLLELKAQEAPAAAAIRAPSEPAPAVPESSPQPSHEAALEVQEGSEQQDSAVLSGSTESIIDSSSSSSSASSEPAKPSSARSTCKPDPVRKKPGRPAKNDPERKKPGRPAKKVATAALPAGAEHVGSSGSGDGGGAAAAAESGDAARQAAMAHLDAGLPCVWHTCAGAQRILWGVHDVVRVFDCKGLVLVVACCVSRLAEYLG